MDPAQALPTRLRPSPLATPTAYLEALSVTPVRNAATPRLLALSLLGALAPLARPQQPDEERDASRPRGFAIPQTREAATLAQRALDHLAARRDADALQTLQELIDAHRGEVLLDPTASASDGSVFVGAGAWARRTLAAASPQVQDAYRARHDAQSQAELMRALSGRDARGLADVARRYPSSRTAIRAWRALGDVEAERGDLDAAHEAWRRAEELESPAGGALTSAAQSRRTQIDSWRAGDAKASALSAPGADAATWVGLLAPENAGGPFARGDSYSLHACVEGDAVLVSDTLRVWAFDAWSGERRWVSAEPRGWIGVDRGQVQPDGERPLRRDDFFEQVDRGQISVRPAAGGGIVVAALQTPFSLVGNRNYQQFRITTVSPERRLAAFDIRSGAPLWDHFPPALWDGDSGPFEQRMSVGAAPVVAGSRVLVGAHRMRGRVDFHVGCYDLGTGALLWSTPLVSGQVELNMFGRAQREYTATPVLVRGARVFVATQMGAVAALDLFTGDILWEALYDQVPIPKAEHWRTEMRRQFFAPSAPLLEGGAVLVAPTDAREMFAFDPTSGQRLWRRPHDFFTRDFQLVSLLGASADTLWASTDRVLLARAPRGMTQGPTGVEASIEIFDTLPRPRPELNATSVVAASGARRLTLDRQRLTEDRRASAEWGPGQLAGNVCLADGAAYFVSDSRVSAVVDWRAVSERFARDCAATPSDPRPHLGWAAILVRRGLAELGEGENQKAATLLQDAAQRLERWTSANDAKVRLQARERYVEAALSTAEALTRSASLRAALEWIERARAQAVEGAMETSVLLRKAELLAALRAPLERLQVLTQLGEAHGDEFMPADWLEREDALRFADLGAGPRLRELRVGAFVALELALEARRNRDAASEFAHLHAILAEYGDLRLPTDALRADVQASAVSQRIGALLAAGEREAYEPYERLAQQWLDRARAANDLERLEQLTQRFPHSRAARLAERSRREAALARADLPAVIQSCVRAAPDEWDLARASEDELHAQWVLRAALTEAGNHEFAAALFERLERDHGATASPLPRDEGRTLAQLAAQSRQRLVKPAAAVRRLTPSSLPARPSSGSFLLLGATSIVSPEGETRWAQLICRRDRNVDVLSAWSGDGAERPLWAVQTPQGAAFPGWRAQFASGTIVIGNRNGLLALEDDTGETRWRWTSGAARIDSFQVRSGVVLVAASSVEGNSVIALDARLGLELWARPTRSEFWSRPVVGEHSLVMLPSDFARSPAEVFDLFTGARLATAALNAHVGLSDLEGAWIEQGRLILPSFPKSSAVGEYDCISAWDLTTGRRSWRVVAEAQQEFDSVLRAGGRTYVILLPRASVQRPMPGAVLDLDLRIGAVGRVSGVALGVHDVLIGVPRHRVVESDHPYLFLRSEGADGASTVVRALHLPFGERWAVRLDIPPSQLNSSGPMPAPIVADGTVAIAYTHLPRSRTARAPANADLVLVERDTGVVRERSALPSELGPADKLEFALLGDTLWISGPNQMLVRR